MFILVRRAQIEGGNRRRPRGTAPCKHYVIHGMFDAYEGFDTIHKVPGKLEWGIYAFALAALVRPGGEHVFSDGHYISWANSYSYVSGSITNPLDDDSYLDRPIGLLTSTDIAWLCGVLGASDTIIRASPRVAGPTAVYDRGALEQAMARQPDSNLNEWLDEQLGLMLKYGVPLAKIARLEDGIVATEHRDGLVLSVPSPQTASHELLANLTSLASEGASVIVLGRCDAISPAILALAGGQCQRDALVPPYYGPVKLMLRKNGLVITSNVSLGSRHSVVEVPGSHGEVLATLVGPGGNSAVTMLRTQNIVYAQLNDFRPPVSGRLQVSNYGTGMPHYVLAIEFSWGPLRVVAGMDPTQPVTLHMLRAPGLPGASTAGGASRIMVLAGNLESNNCGEGSPCAVPTGICSRVITVSVNTKDPTVAEWRLSLLGNAQLLATLLAHAGEVRFQATLPVATCRVFVLEAV